MQEHWLQENLNKPGFQRSDFLFTFYTLPSYYCLHGKQGNPKESLSGKKLTVVPVLGWNQCRTGLSVNFIVHSSSSPGLERPDLLACQGQHCWRRQSKSTYLAILKSLPLQGLICITPMEGLAKRSMRHKMMINEFTAPLLIKQL